MNVVPIFVVHAIMIVVHVMKEVLLVITKNTYGVVKILKHLETS